MAVCVMRKPDKFEKLEEKDFEQFINSSTDLSKAISKVANILQLSGEDFHVRELIWGELIRMIRPYYPDCVIEAYGSSANGFGMKGCDIDLLFLPFPEYCNIDFKDNDNTIPPNPRDVLGNDYYKAALLTMNETCHLKFVQRVFNSKRFYFKKIVFIPAKCPILNLQFRHSQITCDFSSSNRMVLCNTKLQWMYGNMDYRVRPLVIFLRYWAKALGFIQKSQLSSYAFTFMVIFYLQNTEPPVLPSVESLMKLSGQSQKIDEWETAFCDNLNLIPASENSASLGELLMDFFDFYWDFDFTHNVVTPHYGKAKPVRDFLESDDERIKTFQVTAFSIQDPFILSKNVSRNSTMLAAFKLSLLVAKKLLSKRESFQRVFDYASYQAEIDKLFAPMLDDLQASFIPCILYLSNEVCCKLNITNAFHLWYESACLAVLNTLQYGLLFECEVVDKVRWDEADPRPKKKRKLNQDCDVNLELIMSIQCAVYYNTWERRKKDLAAGKKTGIILELPHGDALQQEHIISLNMLPDNQAVSHPLMWLFCNCYKHSSPHISDIIVIFSHLTKNRKMFSSLSSFVKPYVSKMVKRLLSSE